MTIRSMFWDSEGGDRLYTADDFAEVYRKIIDDGFLVSVGSEFEITDPGGGMNLEVGTGAAWIQGKVFEIYDAVETVTIPAADGANPRIDRIVIRLNYADRLIELDVLEGVADPAPVAPALTRVDGVTWEVSIAQVAVAAGALDVGVEDVTVEKEDPALFGGAEIAGFPPTIQSLLNVEADDVSAGDTIVWDGNAFVPSLLQDPATDMVADLLASQAEMAAALWALEADLVGGDVGLANWHGDAFITGLNRMESFTQDAAGSNILGAFRQPSRADGFLGLDDVDPVLSHLFLADSGMVNSIQAVSVSPSGRWVAFSSTASADYYIYVLRMVDGVPDYGNGGRIRPSTNPVGEGADIAWAPDESAIFMVGFTTPYVEAWTWDPDGTAGVDGGVVNGTAVVGGGCFGAKWAAPASTPSNTRYGAQVHPDGEYLLVGGQTSPYIDVYAIDTVAGSFGARSANPGTLPPNTGYAIDWHPSGDYYAVMTQQAVVVYAFNKATGAIGVQEDSVAGLNGVRDGGFTNDGDHLIIGTEESTASKVRGWPFDDVNGIIGAEYAFPAQASHPGESILNGRMVVGDGYAAWSVGGAAEVSGVAIDAAGFVDQPNAYPSSPTYGVVSELPGVGSIIVAVNSSANGYGDPAGTSELTGQAETVTKVLDDNISQIYLLDDAELDANVTRQYDVSVDDGASWVNDVPIGSIVNVAPGNQLRVRITMTRTAQGQSGFIFWFAVWGG